MQFHHAHAFRAQVAGALRAELPGGLRRVGRRRCRADQDPAAGRHEVLAGMRSRRETFERAVRAPPPRQPGLELRRGHVDAVLDDGGRARGLRRRRAGPAGRPGDRRLRPLRSRHPGPAAAPERRRDIGVAYVDRQYQLHDGAEPGPMVNPIAWQADFDGYQVIVFLHERGIFSVLIVRPADEPDLVHLRRTDRVRGRLPCGARARDVDRSGPVPADHGRADGRRAGQPLPRARPVPTARSRCPAWCSSATRSARPRRCSAGA